MKGMRLVPALLLLYLLVPAPALAQTIGEGGFRPRVGLVLSGGAAKGLAHIGVIRALEDLGVPIDMVTGTSMGALIGGLYASGYSGEELTDLVTGLDWTPLFTDQVERRFLGPDRRVTTAGVAFSFPIRNRRIGLPGGAIQGENIQRLLQTLTWRVSPIRDFSRLPTPFAAVTTDLGTGEAVVLTSGNLATALRASMSLPGIFQPMKMDGRILVDGGLVRNLPAQDALDMGADFLICSDVVGPPEASEEVETLVEVLDQSIDFLLELNTEPQRELCDVLIRHRTDGLSASDFQKAGEWIERGEGTTRALVEALEPVVGLQGGSGLTRPRVPVLSNSININRIEVQGITPGVAGRVVLRALALSPPVRLTPEIMDDAIGRIYSTGLFVRAGYRIEASPADTGLIVDVVEEPRDELGFGFRYDERRNASLLFTGTVHNLLAYGSTLTTEARLGEQLRVRSSFLQGLGVTSDFGQGADVSYTSAVFAFFEKGNQEREIRSRSLSFGASVGTLLGSHAMAGLRLGMERAKSSTTIAAEKSKEVTTHLSLQATLYRNTLDERSYPSRGTSLQILSEWATGHFDGGGNYRLNLVTAERAISLTPRTVMNVAGTVGGVAGSEVPVQHLFFLGGAYPSRVYGETQPAFLGLSLQERWGRAVQVFRLSLRQEVRKRFYATATVNAGNAFRSWEFSPRDYTVGWGMALGAGTPIGPVEATLHGRSLASWPMLDLNVGFFF